MKQSPAIRRRPQAALMFLHRAQGIDGHNPIINLNIAIAMTEQGEYSGAMKLFRKILDGQPRMGLQLAQYYMAKIHYLQKKYPEAQQAAREAVANDPNLLEGWILLMNVSEELRDFVAARSDASARHNLEIVSRSDLGVPKDTSRLRGIMPIVELLAA